MNRGSVALAVAFAATAVSLLAATGGTPPSRPADGTYSYAIDGIPGATQDTIAIVTKGTTISAVEHASIGGLTVAAETDYDASTLVPTHYRATQGMVTADATLAGGGARLLVTPTLKYPILRAKLPGTTALTISDGLASFGMMLPSIASAAGTPLSDFAVNGGVVLRVDASSAADPLPSGVPAGDVERAFADSAGTRLTMWSNPATHAVDLIVTGVASFRLTNYSADTSVTTPAPATPPPTPYPLPSANFTTRDVSFASTGDATLAGTLSIPNGTHKPVPAFVFVHGSGPGTRDEGTLPNPTFLELGTALSNAGIAVLRYDKRGVGASTGTATEHWRPLGDDLKAAVAFLRKQPGIDPKRIYVLGHSEGGFVVPMAAPEIEGLAGIVLMAPPAIPMDRILKEQEPRLTPALYAASQKYFADYTGIDPVQVIAKTRVPVLVLQGQRDMQVLPSDMTALQAMAATSHGRVTIVMLPNDDHLFISIPKSHLDDFSEYMIPNPIDPAVAKWILNWMKSHPR